MPLHKQKKPIFEVSPYLRKYLKDQHREIKVPITYNDLFHYKSSITFSNNKGEETLWETIFYEQSDREHIHNGLRQVYAALKADGDLSVMEHLFIDRVDLFPTGNSRPFRVRIVNRINDLFDYFYVKEADASRIYGLELEHLLSPNNVNYLVQGNTLIEDHIQGIPGNQFVEQHLPKGINGKRLAKEFVKFNERCLVQLLGDMRSDNYVVEVIPDFDEVHYRLRSLDFDQEAFEGRRAFYMPQFFKENNAIVALGIQHITPEVELQYQREERSRIAGRIKAEQDKINSLLNAMSHDRIAPEENVDKLKYELAELYGESEFITARSMGEIVKISLKLVMTRPVRTKLVDAV